MNRLLALLVFIPLTVDAISVRVPVNYDGTIDTATRGNKNVVQFLTTTAQPDEQGGTTVDLTVQMINGDASCALYADTSDGTATAATNYTALSNEAVTFSAASDTATVTVTILDADFTGTADFTVTLTKNSCANVTLGASDTATITIQGSGAAGSQFPAGWDYPATTIDAGTNTFSGDVTYTSSDTSWDINSTNDTELWTTGDSLVFPTYPVTLSTDLIVTACVDSASPNTTASYPGAGITIAASNATGAVRGAMKILGPDGSQGTYFSWRESTNGITYNPTNNRSAAAITLPYAVQLKIDKDTNTMRAYVSSSCSSPSFSQFGDSFVNAAWGTGQSVVAGLFCVQNEPGSAGTCGFSPVTGVPYIDTGTVVDFSSPSLIGFTTSTGTYDENGGNTTLSVTRSGGLSGAIEVSITRSGGTCPSSGRFDLDTDPTVVTFADGVGGTDTSTATVTVTDVASAQQNCTVIYTMTKTSGSDTLNTDTFAAIWNDTDASGGTFTTQDASSCSDGYGSFDAFIPGMRGKGSCNRGGFVPNTNVIEVTNRNASGTGSFAAAVAASCPKVILFDVSGLFDLTALTTPLRVGSNSARCDNWSIVGASAPGNVVIEGATSTYGLAAVLQTRGSNWTIDHLTFTGGGNANDAIDISSDTGLQQTNDNGILLNNSFIWGGDEIVQCYPNWATAESNTLLWQNYIGHGVLGHHGAVIVQNTCRNFNAIRNFINDTYGRVPLSRADGLFWANNLTVNSWTDGVRIQPCAGGPVSPIDAAVRVHIIGNLFASGAQGDWTFPSADVVTGSGESLACTTVSLYETGNQWIRANGTFDNCSNHGCVQSGSITSAITENTISTVYPTGYVAETIPSTQAGADAFAALIKSVAGARPQDRLTFIETRMGYATNTVAGSGTESTYVRVLSPGAPTIAADSAIGGAGTGIGVITETPDSWDPTNPGSLNGHSCVMPTGASANTIGSDGLTALHRWAIQCHYDRVMPSGYREAVLDND